MKKKEQEPKDKTQELDEDLNRMLMDAKVSTQVTTAIRHEDASLAKPPCQLIEKYDQRQRERWANRTVNL